MIRCVRNCLTAMLLCVAGTGTVLAQQDLLDYGNTLKFARYLVNTRQYTFAAQEYERLHFLWPEDTTVILELVRTYRLDSDCNQFPNAYGLMAAGNRVFTSDRMAREYLRFCLTCRIPHPLYFDVASRMGREEQACYSLGYYWAQQQYDSLFAYNTRNRELLSGSCPQLYTLTCDFAQQKFKKPVIALALSTVLPGSGKAYSGRWGDAAVSFLLVTSGAYASYRAFHKKGIHSFNGWLFGGIAFSFYASNLFGSFKAARNHNEVLRNQYQNNAADIIHSTF
jgi:hypothetical protein